MCRISTPLKPIRAASSMHCSIESFESSRNLQNEYVDTAMGFTRTVGHEGLGVSPVTMSFSAAAAAPAFNNADPPIAPKTCFPNRRRCIIITHPRTSERLLLRRLRQATATAASHATSQVAGPGPAFDWIAAPAPEFMPKRDFQNA